MESKIRNIYPLFVICLLITVPADVFANETFFSPGGIRDSIIRHINQSTATIDIAISDFTAREMSDVMKSAKARDVHFRIIMDRGHVEKDMKGKSEYDYLIKNGFNVKLLGGCKPGGLMHNKFAIFDRKIVQTGSYTWTGKAEFKSWENIVFIDDLKIVNQYVDYFNRMWIFVEENKEVSEADH